MSSGATPVKLSIMMLALRGRPWQDVHAELARQVTRDGLAGSVELLVELDDGQDTSGVKRTRATRRSAGEYLCFVDDDDELAPDHVRSVYEGCLTGPDVVTFNMRVTGTRHGTETWRLGLHTQDRRRGRMTANHLCAWRRDLALSVGWSPHLGYADDQVWYQPLFHSGRVRREHHVDRVLYHYLYSPAGTRNQVSEKVLHGRRYVGRGLGCYWMGDEVVVETGMDSQPADPGLRRVRDRHGHELVLPAAGLRRFHTITIA